MRNFFFVFRKLFVKTMDVEAFLSFMMNFRKNVAFFKFRFFSRNFRISYFAVFRETDSSEILRKREKCGKNAKTVANNFLVKMISFEKRFFLFTANPSSDRWLQFRTMCFFIDSVNTGHFIWKLIRIKCSRENCVRRIVHQN